ncbi:ABC transporter ATP-binding protein [Humitalea sp. 24SJ18S-53]|uniref:ABC transporter ATP-binding protein n=1 Tax=Humitalea sp. 24SJ18S-53 TaxID=3422307 RepID=UPI003D6749F1
MTNTALTVRGARKSFGAVHALRGVSLDVGRGEFVSFLGPSGCGKTTLLRIIAGFETPTAGEVLIDGKPITHLPPFRRPVGIVFQNLALFPHLSVASNVGFGLAVRREDGASAKRKIDDILALVELQGFGDRRMHQLSGGQRQRVALARALIMQPDVLLLDEPLSALDLKLRRQLQGELKRLQRRTGTTFVFVTHDQEEALAMSDRVAVFRDGQIDQVGTPEEVYRRPATRFVAEFVGETNILEVRTQHGQASIMNFGGVMVPSQVALPDSATLSLRPESVALLRADDTQGVAATVADLEFGGMTLRMVAHIPGIAQPIRAALPADRAPSGLAVGDTVRLSFDLGAAALLPGAG